MKFKSRQSLTSMFENKDGKQDLTAVIPNILSTKKAILCAIVTVAESRGDTHKLDKGPYIVTEILRCYVDKSY